MVFILIVNCLKNSSGNRSFVSVIYLVTWQIAICHYSFFTSSHLTFTPPHRHTIYLMGLYLFLYSMNLHCVPISPRSLTPSPISPSPLNKKRHPSGCLFLFKSIFLLVQFFLESSPNRNNGILFHYSSSPTFLSEI